MKSTLATQRQILSTLTAVVTTVVAINIPLAQAQNQEPLAGDIVNAIAAKTIQKFNNSSCQDLAASMAAKKAAQGNPAPETLKDKLTEKFIVLLQENPQLTEQFFSQISTPVLTKLFECGLIPPQE